MAVALVEAADFAGGVSWNSLKTIHGGLRHLQRLDLAGLRESDRERRALLRIAPGLVRPLGFVALASGRGTSGRAALHLGILAASLLSGGGEDGGTAAATLPPSRILSEKEIVALVPGLVSARRGGALWWDAQVESSER